MGWLLRTTLVPAFLYSSNTSTPYYGLADFRALQRTKRQMSGFGVSASHQSPNVLSISFQIKLPLGSVSPAKVSAWFWKRISTSKGKTQSYKDLHSPAHWEKRSHVLPRLRSSVKADDATEITIGKPSTAVTCPLWATLTPPGRS